MNQRIIEFLIAKYGNRVDYAQPIIDTDNESIQNQLTLVDRRIIKARRMGLLWASLGVILIIRAVVTVATEPLGAITLFNAGLGIFFLVSGLVLFNQTSDLKRKKLILETILFIHKDLP